MERKMVSFILIGVLVGLAVGVSASYVAYLTAPGEIMGRSYRI